MPETFGERIRRVRQQKKLGLRKTASMVGISATFLSRVETGKEQVTPSEDTIRKLADTIGDDFDALMQLADRIPTSIKNFINADPGMPEFMRLAQQRNIPSEKLIELLKKAEQESDD